MTKIPSVEERVEEYKDTNYHTGEKPNQNAEWVRQALTAERTALLTELRGNLLLNELPIKNEWVGGYNTLARAMKAHLDELIKSNSV